MSRKRRGSYRPEMSIMDQGLRHEEALELGPIFEQLRSSTLPEAFQVGLALVLTTLHRRQSLAFEGFRNTTKTFDDISWTQIPLCKHFVSNHPSAHKFSDLSLAQLVLGCRWRAVPDRAQLALQLWLEDPSRVILCEHMPTAMEMLEFQTMGKRAVTWTFRHEFLSNEVAHGRDHHSFLCHDLCHLWKFFGDPVSYEQQIGFFKRLQFWLEQNPKNWSDPNWTYLASDMNSELPHLESMFNRLAQVRA